MIHIDRTQDCHLIDPPELQREVISYLLYCQYEVQQFADEDDEFDAHFSVLSAEDLPTLDNMLNALGPPEETVQINIKTDGIVQTMYRIVYPTEVLFIPAEISDQNSF